MHSSQRDPVVHLAQKLIELEHFLHWFTPEVEDGHVPGSSAQSAMHFELSLVKKLASSHFVQNKLLEQVTHLLIAVEQNLHQLKVVSK